MKTISIPAAVNGVDGVYNETFATPGFAIQAASGSFFIRIRNGQKQKISTGQQIGSDSGRALGSVQFLNPSATAIDVTLGDYGAAVVSIPPDLVNVSGVNSFTNPFAYGIYQPGTTATDPFTSSIPILSQKPFRRIWSFFDAGTFTWTFNYVYLEFLLGTTSVLVLPLRYKLDSSPLNFGIAMCPDFNNANPATPPVPNCMFYKSIGNDSDSSNKTFLLPPFDCRVQADSCRIRSAQAGSGTISGTVHAFVAVLSAEEKF